MMRFRKALYLFELVSTAFPWTDVGRGGEAAHFRIWKRLYDKVSLWTDMGQRDENETAQFRTWKRLCDEVAPWEMEQVRCIQKLILLVLPGVVKATSECIRRSEECMQLKYLYGYVLTQGLAGLRQLDNTKDSQANYTKATQFCYLMHHGTDEYEKGNDTRAVAFDWSLEFEKFEYVDLRTNLHAGKIFEKYPEEDPGPKAWWYYSILRIYAGYETNWLLPVWASCEQVD
ncbi:hypothetical protein E0Z10_g2156 [Xylaria hypoxylon]|uniref:Uncharacterized protein n=1 Tax=Xylaria hypoxylon TaxID=37992 RepID=A0A4Z0Z4K7_9PEZI|nr:hypothetical protein E0Z10_g2156 [Xylaria hypoxylon]